MSWNAVEVVAGSELADEPLGTKQKFWVENPDDDRPWLFKFARERDGSVRGEDWAEWLVHQVAILIGVPSATVLPAQCVGRRGIVSRSVIGTVGVERLVHGNSLLVDIDAEYQPDLMRSNPRYTIDSVFEALDGVQQPIEFNGPRSFRAFDVWAGFLVMDALVAGRDRHHENWGIISSQSGRRLAPSYDHGNALAFQEDDTKLERLLADPAAAAAWVHRGRSHHFAERPSLVALAHGALRLSAAAAREYWRARLESISERQVASIVESVPSEIMSDPARRFAIDILFMNRGRLLDDYPGH